MMNDCKFIADGFANSTSENVLGIGIEECSFYDSQFNDVEFLSKGVYVSTVLVVGVSVEESEFIRLSMYQVDFISQGSMQAQDCIGVLTDRFNDFSETTLSYCNWIANLTILSQQDATGLFLFGQFTSCSMYNVSFLSMGEAQGDVVAYGMVLNMEFVTTELVEVGFENFMTLTSDEECGIYIKQQVVSEGDILFYESNLTEVTMLSSPGNICNNVTCLDSRICNSQFSAPTDEIVMDSSVYDSCSLVDTVFTAVNIFLTTTGGNFEDSNLVRTHFNSNTPFTSLIFSQAALICQSTMNETLIPDIGDCTRGNPLVDSCLAISPSPSPFPLSFSFSVAISLSFTITIALSFTITIALSFTIAIALSFTIAIAISLSSSSKHLLCLLEGDIK